MNNIKIAVIGLGYVGLPLARLFSTKYQTIGFDMNQSRVDALNAGHDATLEVADNLLQDAIKNHGFKCTTSIEDIRECNFYVVAVPTPVDENNRPDLRPLWGASETVGKVISKGDIVVYESTVYPGVTEEECLPVVERISGLTFNKDFYAGYSPERINPGDKEHTVEKIKKVTSGSTPEIADIVDNVYNSVLINGTHKEPTIAIFTGHFFTTTSATALPRPPITECSSAVTIAPVSEAAFTMISSSRGLIVCMSITRALMPLPASSSAAIIASFTMMPVAIIATSLPSRRQLPLPSWIAAAISSS